jgi:hypothetical protein
MKKAIMLNSRINYTGYFILVFISMPAMAGCSARLADSRIVSTIELSEPIQAVLTPTIIPPVTPTELASLTPTEAATLIPTVTITASDPEVTLTATLEPTLTDTIAWTDAGLYEGEERVVCGPVAGTHFAEDSRGQPTFLNVGEDYPSPERFVVLIWGDDRPNFASAPEDYYEGETICARGEIQEYEGVFEIEIRSPEQIEIQE